MDARISGFLSQPRFRSLLVGIFALVALALASIGLYGVLAFQVRQRSKEICLRMALGAQSANVLQLVLTRGLTLVGLGIIIGITASLMAGRLIQGTLFGVEASDPLTVISVSLTLVAVSLVACLVPALRAARLDPGAVLKDE
jgi:ABC-type antimicrobial peptide transport system permease subunit